MESPQVDARFLQVLKPGFETASKLPPAFSRMLMNDTYLNSKTVVLKSYKGSWEIDVLKCDSKCVHFLGKTWEGYVSDHNLKEGDTIVFEHNGHLHFNTIMFDEMGGEKDSSFSEEERNTSVEKDFAFSEKEEEEKNTSEDDVEGCFDEHVQHLDEKDEEQDINDEDDVTIKDNYGLTADQIANCSRFQITLRKWAFETGWTCDPRQFGTSNDMMQYKTVKLQNGTGNSWLAGLKIPKKTQANKPPRTRFVLTGLIKFLRDNKLEVGDKCTFKLSQPSSSSQDQHVVMDVEFERRKREEGSQFEWTLAQWNFTHYYTIVPLSFARSNDMMRDRTVKLQNGTGDSWLVKLSVPHTKRERVFLTSLAEFMRDNDLQVGDTCIFKLVQPSTKQEHVVMDAVVLRKP